MDTDIARRDLAEQRRNPQHHGHVDYERQMDHDLTRHSPPRAGSARAMAGSVIH